MARLTLLVILTLLAPGLAVAQDDTPPPPPTEQAEPEQPTIDPRYQSPRATMRTFIRAAATYTSSTASADAKARARDEIIKALDLDDIQLESLDDTVAAIVNILGRLGDDEADILQGMPDADVAERMNLDQYDVLMDGPHRRRALQLLQRHPDGVIRLEPIDGVWTFTPDTVRGSREFFIRVSDIAARSAEVTADLTLSLRLEAFMTRQAPGIANARFLGMAGWKWLALLIIAFIGVVIDYTVRAILRFTWHRFANRQGIKVDPKTLSRAVRPFGIFAAALIWLALIRVVGLPDVALKALLVAVKLVLTLGAVWGAYRIVDLVCEFFARKAAVTTTKVDDLLIPLVRKTGKVFVTAMGIVYIANALNIEIVPLLTGLGIGGLAVAFAAKDTIENFFGSIAVIADRPFEVGDWVVIGEVEGTVEHLGFRSTRIRTFYNSLITVPNATLVRANVDNYGRRRFRRFKTHLGVAYDTEPDTIEAFCEGIRELVRLHPYTRKDYYQVWLHQFGPASLDILLYIFHQCPDWQTELRERHRLMLDILRLANKLGVEIAFPTQTLYLRQDDGPAKPDADAVTSKNAELKSMTEGRRAARDLTSNAPWLESKPPPFDFQGEMAAGSAGDG